MQGAKPKCGCEFGMYWMCVSIKSGGGWVGGDFSPHSEIVVAMHRVSTLTGDKGAQRGARAAPQIAAGLQGRVSPTFNYSV